MKKRQSNRKWLKSINEININQQWNNKHERTESPYAYILFPLIDLVYYALSGNCGHSELNINVVGSVLIEKPK